MITLFSLAFAFDIMCFAALGSYKIRLQTNESIAKFNIQMTKTEVNFQKLVKSIHKLGKALSNRV